MVSKLLYLLMHWEKFNEFPALEQVQGEFKALQTSMMVLLTKIITNVSLKTLTILAKKINLRCLAGSRTCVCRYVYITALKIQTKICIDGRQVKFLINYFHWSLSHKSTIKTTIECIYAVPLSRIFFGKFSANYYQCIFDRVYF